MDKDIELKLSAQRALLGEVTIGLRAVSTELIGNVIKWRCVFESEQAKENQWENLSVAATEVIADYSDEFTIEEEYLVTPLAESIIHLKNIVYLRHE